MPHWGVDSDDVVTTDLIAQVRSQAGRTPEFWGRYIGGGIGTPLSAAEAQLIQGSGMRVMLIYNNAGPTDAAGGFSSGQRHARIAIASAAALNVPAGAFKCIYCDLEAWNTSADFMTGWVATIQGANYRAGFYGSVSLPTFAQGFCASQRLSPMSYTHVFLYANQPSNFTTATNLGSDGQPATYAPALPACASSTQVFGAVWQYLMSNGATAVDADLCTEQGFDSMW